MSSGEERQNDNSLSRSPPKHPAQTVHTHTLYTTFVCVLRLCRFPLLLIYGILQVAPRRCRALQFMSNLVNILSPVRPVSRCFSSLPVFPPSSSPPRVLSSTPNPPHPHIPSRPSHRVTGRNQAWIPPICIPSDLFPSVVLQAVALKVSPLNCAWTRPHCCRAASCAGKKKKGNKHLIFKLCGGKKRPKSVSSRVFCAVQYLLADACIARWRAH